MSSYTGLLLTPSDAEQRASVVSNNEASREANPTSDHENDHHSAGQQVSASASSSNFGNVSDTRRPSIPYHRQEVVIGFHEFTPRPHNANRRRRISRGQPIECHHVEVLLPRRLPWDPPVPTATAVPPRASAASPTYASMNPIKYKTHSLTQMLQLRDVPVIDDIGGGEQTRYQTLLEDHWANDEESCDPIPPEYQSRHGWEYLRAALWGGTVGN